MCKTHDELINYPIDPNGSTNQFQSSVIRISKDEMVCVERSQSLPADSARDLFPLHISEFRLKQ